MGNRPSSTTLEPEMAPAELAGLETWIRSASLPGPHLEVGTAAGGTLCFLQKQYPPATRPAFVVVDTMTYFLDQFETIKRNLRAHDLDPEQTDFRVMNSSEAFAAASARGERFDFILVDASHKIRYMMDDLRWLRLLNTGGLACFHDYGPQFPGVRWPLNRFLRRNPHFSRVGQAGTLLCLRKERESDRAEVTFGDQLWASICSVFLQWKRSLSKRLPG